MTWRRLCMSWPGWAMPCLDIHQSFSHSFSQSIVRIMQFVFCHGRRRRQAGVIRPLGADWQLYHRWRRKRQIGCSTDRARIYTDTISGVAGTGEIQLVIPLSTHGHRLGLCRRHSSTGQSRRRRQRLLRTELTPCRLRDAVGDQHLSWTVTERGLALISLTRRRRRWIAGLLL